MRTFLRTTFTVVVISAAASCDTSTEPGPQAGPLSVMLATPNADDAGIVFVVSGGKIDSVTTAPGTAYQLLASTDAAPNVLVRGSLTSGAVARVWVPDVKAAYTAAIREAAARTTYAQRSLAGYTMTVAPP